MKVAVIFHRFGPYHLARLEAAAGRCEVAAIELASDTKEYGWGKIAHAGGYRRATLFQQADSRDAATAEVEYRVRHALAENRPDVVAIPGWSDPAAFAALRWCAQTRTPAVLMSESTAQDEPRVWWKEWMKRRIVGLYSTALVGGKLHADYLSQLGIPRERVFTGYDVVDNEHFAQGAKLRNRKSEVRNCAGLPENYFLAAARFIAKKNLSTLLRAYATYRKRETPDSGHGSPWRFVLLGDGPLKSELRELISDLALKDSVLLPGFQQYDELPRYYAGANAFVHASTTEQWGLVVNEAMASGLPVIISNRCGCAPELVREGVNGFAFEPTDQEELADCLSRMASLSREERERFSASSSEIISQFGKERFGEGLLRAAELALRLPRKHANCLDRCLLWAVMRK